MHKLRWTMFLFTLIAVLLSLPVIASSATEAQRMTADELKARLGEPGLLIVDVRTGGSWSLSDSKIAGAERVEPDELVDWAASHDKGDTVVFYCS